MGPSPGAPLAGLTSIRLLWWNVESFAHFSVEHQDQHRWPVCLEAYSEKCGRVDAVLGEVMQGEVPDIIALGEITKNAAEDLQRRLFPEHRLLSLDLHPDAPSFQVAVIYRDLPQFSEVLPVVVPFAPRGTRPMAVLDFNESQQQIRFVFVHWSAPFSDNSVRTQERIAGHLQGYIYEFLREEQIASSRHIVVVGDFNTEPFEILHTHFDATRSRQRAREPEHYSDTDVRRIRLYNAGWRLLGENKAHQPGLQALGIAGSYYCRGDRAWRTVDQLLVSGSLLKPDPPCLLEDTVELFAANAIMGEDGYPRAFEWEPDRSRGASDHLPLTATIRLKRS